MAEEHHAVPETDQTGGSELQTGRDRDDTAIIVAMIALLARELVRPSNWRSPPDADRTLH